jgi:hypothetical protein
MSFSGRPDAIQSASLLKKSESRCTSNGGHGEEGFASQFHWLLAGIAIAHHSGANFASVPFFPAHHANITEMEKFPGAAHAFHDWEALSSFASHA